MLSAQEKAGRLRIAASIALACALGAVCAAPARASFVTGIDSNGLFTADDPAEAARWYDTTVDLNAGIARLDLGWRDVAPTRPEHPTNPADPAYDFTLLDRAVTDAAARHLKVVFVLAQAPKWAQASGGGDEVPGAWKPDPDALGAFAQAVATRYSGHFDGLPRVRYYDAWNEANLSSFLAPQYEGNEAVAVERYRLMVNAVYRGVHAADPNGKVIVGSLGPYGDEDPGGTRTRPVNFLRQLFCLNRSLHATACPTKTHVDIFSHHAINQTAGPRKHALDPDDASSADLPRVRKVLRAAERAHTITGGPKHHPLWVTEFWWESHPPEQPNPAIPGLRKHARWIEEALYLYWKAGAKAAIYYSLEDDPLAPSFSALQAGLYFVNGTPKPAATAFAFPFVTERSSGKHVHAWGKAPASGKLKIERKTQGGWRRVATVNAKAGSIFTTHLKIEGKATLRATVAGERSLPWTQRRN
jgi:hypothetical protein